MKTSQRILDFYEFRWRIYDQVLIALITANPPASLAVCRCQLGYSAEEYFENILQNLEYVQKKRLRKLRVKVNKEE